jgi:multiple sugar transport system permease protein
MATLAETIADAARIDGAGPVRMLVGVLLPVVKNGVVVAIILTFGAAWGEYLLAKTLNTRLASQTLPVVLASGWGGMSARAWPHIAAVHVMAIAPGLIVFGLPQRWYMRGLQEGALKG